MAFTFNSTVGDAAANSYVSVETADDFFTAHLDREFWPSRLIDKQSALVMATSRLDSEIYGGRRTAELVQRLQWPRAYIIDRDKDKNQESVAEFIGGNYYRPSDEIPKELEEATLELALYYLKQKAGEFTIDDNDLETLGSYKIGPITTTIKPGIKADRLPTKVKRLLQAIGPNAWQGEKPLTFQR